MVNNDIFSFPQKYILDEIFLLADLFSYDDKYHNAQIVIFNDLIFLEKDNIKYENAYVNIKIKKANNSPRMSSKITDSMIKYKFKP